MYDELVRRLRGSVDWRSEEKCDGCPYEYDYPCCVDCLEKMHGQAAKVIEELCKFAGTMRKLKCEGWYLQQTKYHDGYQEISTMPLPDPPKEES